MQFTTGQLAAVDVTLVVVMLLFDIWTERKERVTLYL
jgi:hypothetical protein